MDCQRLSQKLVLAGFLAITFTGLTAAASIDTTGNDVVWKNSDWVVEEVEAVCSSGNIENVTVSGNKIFSGDVNSTELTTSDFSEIDAGTNQDVELYCKNGTYDDTEVKFANFSLDFEKEGVGFVGEIMKDKRGSLGNKDGITIDPAFGASGYEVNDLEDSDFAFTGAISVLSENVRFVDTKIDLYPRVDTYPDSKVSLNITADQLDLSKEFAFEPFVHKWKATKVGGSNPGRDINYEDVDQGNYEYYLDMQYEDLDDLPETDLLDSNNFRLTVKELDSNGEYVLADNSEYEDDDYEKMSVLKQDNPSSSEANYRIRIDDYKKLDALKAGKYKFIFEVVYEPDGLASNKEFVVDETRVDKSSEFSGVILNADGNGVKTLMELRNPDTKRNIESEGDGYFSAEIGEEEFDTLSAEFYDTTKDTSTTPDATVSLSDVGLDNADLGPGGSAINFHYWNNPQISVEGLKPVNMMAAKFGYPIGSVSNIRMSFESGKLDPKAMQIYECNEWNFDGQDCMDAWNEVDSNSIEINPATWEAVIDGEAIGEYNVEGENIFMSAYVIGTNSELALQNSVSVDSYEIKYNEEMTASGIVVDENGNKVEDANVTLTLVNDKTSQDWTVQTDSTGTFEFSEKVAVDKGNYKLKLEASKPPYEDFEMESDSTVEVYYEAGIDVRSQESSPRIKQGEEDSFLFEISNTGQQPINIEEIDVTGLDNDYFSLNPSSLDSIAKEETEEVEVIVNLPGDYCSYPCGDSPNFDISVSGTSNGESVSSEITVPTTLEVESDNTDEESSTDSTQEKDNTTSSSSVSPVNSIQNVTGDFVERQSDLNIALALIMIFTMMLAAAVKKKKTGDDRERRRGRPDVSKPPVAAAPPHEDALDEDEADKSQGSQGENNEPNEEDETEEKGKAANVCDVCGEEFESETGVKLHKDAVH